MIYKLIGKLVVHGAAFFIKRKYGRLQLGVVGAIVVALGIGAFLAASRQLEEG